MYKNIHAYTALSNPYPAYISINEDTAKGEKSVTVRSTGEQMGSQIVLTDTELTKMAVDVLKQVNPNLLKDPTA